MKQQQTHRRIRSGFTLVEILVVITIIGILMGILIPAVTGFIATGRETAVRMQIDVIDQALEAYKLKHGEYPPDFSDWKQVERHFRKAFPEIDDDELKLLAQYTHLDSNFDRVPVEGSGATANVDPRPNGSGYSHYRQAIDGAEALVFCLGGFSGDKKHPFTGQGGPLSPITMPRTASGGGVVSDYVLYQYNTARDNSFLELDSTQLSIGIANEPGGGGDLTPSNPCEAASAYTISTDEYQRDVTGTVVNNAYSTRSSTAPFDDIVFLLDPFPVFNSDDDGNPLVYFASSAYTKTFTPTFERAVGSSMADWLAAGNQWHNLNVYIHPVGESDNGVARPYLSSQLDTNAGGFLWVEKDRYQLIATGRDGSYGGTFSAGVVVPSSLTTTASAAGVVTVYPTGQFANAAGALAGSGSTDKYAESFYGAETPQRDNITNFATRTLESDLP